MTISPFPCAFLSPYPKQDIYNAVWISDLDEPLWRVRVLRANGWIEVATFDIDQRVWTTTEAGTASLRDAVIEFARQSPWVVFLDRRDEPEFAPLFKKERLQ
ncbi:hypothetical protein EDC40_10354 [Aminobacter aminovorans]|uniref:Uncharacterized protein n=1 Tax=Aminobacter aminovorans TaxID=83263 RepID=A0A380WMH2_AMIAI|nr:hypothetical protein [Aminobacter aminovorans]TCS27589.1 hypothetical protein EDC40_10354 [Aminobacter aminovorans]SUU89998.1 Uncharacterised protein [Aminobacter aminovorans]